MLTKLKKWIIFRGSFDVTQSLAKYLCLINSNTIELTLHTSVILVLDLLCVTVIQNLISLAGLLITYVKEWSSIFSKVKSLVCYKLWNYTAEINLHPAVVAERSNLSFATIKKYINLLKQPLPKDLCIL